MNGAFHVYNDTLANAIHTGSVTLTDALLPFGPTLPVDGVNAMEATLYCATDDWILSSTDNAANEITIPAGTIFIIPLVAPNINKLWVRQAAGSGSSLSFMLMYKKPNSNIP